MSKVAIAVALAVMVPGAATAEVMVYGSADYVARAGDDGTHEHVTVVRSRNAIVGFTTAVAYDKAVVLDERADGYTIAYTSGFGFVPAWSFLGLPRFAILSIDAAQIEATTTVFDCDLDGFCDTVSSEATEGRLELRWTPTGPTARHAGTTVNDSGDVIIRTSGVSFETPAFAHGLAFAGDLDLAGDLSAAINLTVQIDR